MIKLKDILSEIKIIRPTTQIKFNNRVVNKSTSIPGEESNEVRTYNWENGKKLLSTITRRNAERLFIEILGITPEWVKIEISPKALNSYYIYGEYNGEPILIVRRQTESPSAGQTKLKSKYATFQLNHILGYYDHREDMIKNIGMYASPEEKQKWEKKNKQKYWQSNTKENILKALKINV